MKELPIHFEWKRTSEGLHLYPNKQDRLWFYLRSGALWT